MSTNLHHLQVISFSRGPFLFIFNFHPANSYEKYDVGIEEAGEYTVSCSILCIDIPSFICHFFLIRVSVETKVLFSMKYSCYCFLHLSFSWIEHSHYCKVFFCISPDNITWILQMILNSDEVKYGGQGLLTEDQYLQRSISKRFVVVT